jgi:hypothetical protein
MTEGERDLDRASRIYYGIHHPIQYNVKVKDVGYVVPNQVHTLIQNWKEEDGETKQSGKVTANAEMPQELLEGTGETSGVDHDAEDLDDYNARRKTPSFQSHANPSMFILACYHALG